MAARCLGHCGMLAQLLLHTLHCICQNSLWLVTQSQLLISCQLRAKNKMTRIREEEEEVSCIVFTFVFCKKILIRNYLIINTMQFSACDQNITCCDEH